MPVESKSDTVSSPVTEKSPLELSVEKLYNTVNGVVGKSATAEEKLQTIQPVLEEVGQAILAVVKSSVGEVTPTPVPQNDAVLEAIQALRSEISTIGTEVATLKAQTKVTNDVPNRVPVPRSLVLENKSAVPEQPTNGNSVKDIVRRSVGL